MQIIECLTSSVWGDQKYKTEKQFSNNTHTSYIYETNITNTKHTQTNRAQRTKYNTNRPTTNKQTIINKLNACNKNNHEHAAFEYKQKTTHTINTNMHNEHETWNNNKRTW